jgi:GT2 family glycosyltransferase
MSGGALVDVLIPTCNRPCAFVAVLTALFAQNFQRFRIVVSDQSDRCGLFSTREVLALLRMLHAREVPVTTLRNLPRRGMAEQRAFLLSRSSAPYCLFLDDDVIVEPDLLARLYKAITEQRCGFVGSALHGLSYLFDRRPAQQEIELWEDGVTPEQVLPGTSAWDRHHLHSAANLYHVQQRLALERAGTRCYRVAWVGGCVLFDSDKLRAAGGFDFWRQLPPEHCGEDVLAQLRVMEKFGGCGIIPSGAYHMELPTTITRRDVDAPQVLWQ